MTIGERIQQYRKKLGLSQEELGQTLFVSRQTVSQWETDQTMPTVDNLLRLKELFGVSVDEILEGQTEETADDKEEEMSLEAYRMTFTEDELKARNRECLWRSLKPMLVFLLVSVFVAVQLSRTKSGFPSLFTLGASVSMFIFFLVIGIRTGKQITKENKRIVDTVYYYRVFRDRFSAEIEKNGEIMIKAIIPFSDIRSIREIGDLIVVSTQSRAFLLKTSQIPRDSAIVRLQKEIVLRTHFTRATGIWKFLSIMLCILSVAVWPLAMQIVTRDSTSATAMELSAAEVFRDSWIAYLFLPIPIASIVFGFVLKKKHFYYKKNIIFGIFSFMTLCTFGSFFLIFTPEVF